MCGKQKGREGRHPHKLWTKDPWKRTVIRRVRRTETEGRNSVKETHGGNDGQTRVLIGEVLRRGTKNHNHHDDHN